MSAHADARPDGSPEQAATGTRRCLVVGYDGGESSCRAVRWAALQLAPDGKLVLVHACRPLHAPPSPLSSEQERHTVAHAMFDELLLEGDESLLQTLAHTQLADTDPVTALTRAANEYHADAIVVGHEPHSRLHAAVGTVTSTLLAHAQIPVTIVPGNPG